LPRLRNVLGMSAYAYQEGHFVGSGQGAGAVIPPQEGPPLTGAARHRAGRDGRMAPPEAEPKNGSTQAGNMPSNQIG
jgi:hypothetical protein